MPLIAHLALQRLTAQHDHQGPGLAPGMRCHRTQRPCTATARSSSPAWSALAVPVRDAKGQVRAAIAVHAPSVRMNTAAAVARLPALAAAAKRMGRLL